MQIIVWVKNLFKKKPVMYCILRTYHPEATTGVLLDPLGNHLCFTLERPWLDNKHDVSCIPEGTYNVVSYQSPTKGDVWMLQNVEDRTNIEIHSANYMEQLLGCIAVGSGIAENIVYNELIHRYWLNNSKPVLRRLKVGLLPDKFILDIRKG